MSAAKKEHQIRQVAPEIDPHEIRRVLHRIPIPWYDENSKENGQPKLEGGSGKLSYGLGMQEISHAEASDLYLKAVESEDKARAVRKFWATVLANWETLTESAE